MVIIGGNDVGLETALYLANQGTLSPDILHFLMTNRAESIETLTELLNKGNMEAIVVEMTKKAGKDIGLSTRWTGAGVKSALDSSFLWRCRIALIDL